MPHLLDTQALLWWLADDARLSADARSAIIANECLVSLASCWEMAIKISIGKLSLDTPIDRFIPEQLAWNGFTMLEIQLSHVARVSVLPLHHRDPFDRLLAAQALSEDIPIVSNDDVFRDYGVKRVW